MQSPVRVAATVVLYNPSANNIDNIDSYSSDVGLVYVVDNSERPDPAIVARLAGMPKVVYVANPGNLGIANAFNVGAEQALADGYEYLLTMDQDSTATPGMIAAMLACLHNMAGASIGIVSPCHQLGDTFTAPQAAWDELEVAMASGNLLNLSAYKAVGPFRDDYFIDYVDHEYCLRLRQHGYRVVRANRAILRHRLGAMTWHRLLWKRIKLGNHPPLRRYYAFRNRFHLYRQYHQTFPVYFRYFYREIFQELFAVLLYEQQRFAKMKMMLRGYLDYRQGVFGKYGERG